MKGYLLILFFALAFCQNLYCQKKTQEVVFPTLNGHKVVSLSNARSPFHQSQLYLNLELGNSAVFSSTGVDLGDTTIFQLTNELLYTRLGLGYQQRIKDWISFYARLDFGARLGTDAGSLLIEGVNTIESIEVGISFRISEGEKHAISGYLKTHNVKAEIIDVRQFISDIIDENTKASIQKSVPALNVGMGAVASFAPYKFLGLNFNGQISYGETLQRGTSAFLYEAGGSVDLMLNDWINVPLSLVVGGSLNTIPNIFSIDGDLTSNFQVKLAYNKSDDFVLSIETYGGQSPIANSTRRIDINGFIINSIFYF